MATVASCAPGWKRAPHDRPFQRVIELQVHEPPRGSLLTSDWWNHVLHGAVIPLAKALSPARYLDRAIGPRVALDINDFGQVPDSPWFHNRIGRGGMSAADVRRGPNVGGGPASGPLLIISGKTAGATPGFVVRDSRKQVWFVKFDPPAFAEMTTGAEIIGSRVLHAAGYHVPETHLVDLDVQRLRLSPKATRRDGYNRTVPMRSSDLTRLLVLLNPDPKGRLRAVFSRAVPGRPLGPFVYRGIRADDPNDRIPHERRRSLRGLRLISAWINNTDTRAHNTMDTFVAERPGARLGYVRHYLIDFGDAIGAAGNRQKYTGEGYAHLIDWREIAKGLVLGGLHYPPHLRLHRSPYRAIGHFESKVFHPARWRPQFANPAFDEAGAGDNVWAAALIARFTEPLIRALVSEARYSEEGAADYVVEILLERRAKILRWAFRGNAALDRPRMDGRYVVVLDDLAVQGNLRSGPQRFRWQVRWNRSRRKDVVVGSGVVTGPRFNVRAPLRRVMMASQRAFTAEPYLTLRVRRLAGDGAGPWIDIHLRAAHDFVFPVGIRRARQ